MMLIFLSFVAVAIANCNLPTGFQGVCKEPSLCAGKGISTATGQCPGTELCCTVESCFVNGQRGVCVEPGTCAGTTHSRFCTGSGVCCTSGAAPVCTSAPTSKNTVVDVRDIYGEFFDGDRESVTKIEYCGTSASASCPQVSPSSVAQVRWSTPSTSSSDQGFTGKSGLGFQPSTISKVVLNEPFPLATLTHYNWVVTGNTPGFVHIRIKLTVNNFQLPYFSFKLGIEETNNAVGLTACAYPSVVPCADKIDFPDGVQSFANGDKLAGSVKFNLPGSNVDLTLELTGFKQNCASGVLDNWYTQEKVVNQAVLYGRITRACPIAASCPQGQVSYDSGNCRCTIPPPTNPPVTATRVSATPTPSPVPVTTKPGDPPTTSTTTTTTVVEATADSFVLDTVPVVTEADCQPWWSDKCQFTAQAFPESTPANIVTSAPLVFVESSSPSNAPLIAGIVGGVGALLLVIAVVALVLLLRRNRAAKTGAGAAKPSAETIVEGNPLFQAQTKATYNPVFYPAPADY